MPDIKNQHNKELIRNLGNKETEETFQLHEKSFKSIMEKSSDIILILNKEGIIKYTNHSTENLFGVKPKEMLYKNVSDFIYPESLNTLNKVLSAEINSGKFKLRIVSSDNKRHLLEVNVQDFSDDPKIKGIVMNAHDITDREINKHDLWKSEGNALVENITEPVIIIDIDGNVLYTNKATSYFIGSESVMDFTGANIKNYVHSDYIEPVIKRIKQFIKNEDRFSAKYKIKLFKGEEKWIDTTGKNIKFEGHSAMMVTIRDFTKRKKIEEQLKESEESLRVVLNSVNDAIFIHDLDGSIVNFNQKMLEMYGVNKDEATFFSIMEDYSSSENPIHKLPEIWKRVISGETEVFEWKSRRPKDGSLFDVEVFLRKIRLKNNDYILATVRDITEHKNVERQIRLALIQKELLIEEIYRRAEISLCPISSLIELQMEYYQDNDVNEFYKENMNRYRVIALLNKKLSTHDNIATLDFKDFVQGIIDGLLEFYNVDDGIKIQIEGNILMDIDLVVPCGLIINELVSNSLKHAFTNRNRGNVKIKLSSDDGKINLVVEDDGNGLPEDVDVFNTKTMGFNLIDVLVEQLCGTVELRRNNGTLFEIEIWTPDIQKYLNNLKLD